MASALIFGANGQDGYYLNRLLTEQGFSVAGISRSGNWIHADIGNYTQVTDLIRHYQPEYIFHLAANSTPRHDAIFENHLTISSGTLNILEAVRIHAPFCRIFLSGSGLQFVNRALPIKETDPFDASSPYSVSRIQSVYAARYFRSLGIRVYVGYLFNHESPLRPERHMSKKIAALAQRVANGSREHLEIGDITVSKEWAFAGDIVKGMLTLTQQDDIFEAAIGSGLAYTIEDWLDACFEFIGHNWRNHVSLIDGFKAEYRILVSDPATISSLGWKPLVSFTSLAKMMVDEK